MQRYALCSYRTQFGNIDEIRILLARSKRSRTGGNRVFHAQTTQINLSLNRHSQITSRASKTGPSTQALLFPSEVATTQERQAPIPHAILFSKEIAVGT